MQEDYDIFEIIQVKRYLQEINHFILHNEGEIRAIPGKVSLVWNNSLTQNQHFLAVKLASEQQILVNGRRYPATEAGLKQGLAACLADLH